MIVRVVAASGLIAVTLTAWYVSISSQCTRAPPRYWLSSFEVELRLKEAGLSLLSLRANEDRCFEALATDRLGSRYGLLVNPENGAILAQEAVAATVDAARIEPPAPRAQPRAVD